MSCTKCKTDCEVKGSSYVEGGKTFYFCKYCCQVLNELATGNIRNFLNDKELAMISNPILKNIIQARINRGQKVENRNGNVT